MTFLFVPAKQPDSIVEEMLFGYTMLYSDTAVIFLTNDSTQNRFIVAHETGHMMGIEHRKISFWQRIIDPFGIMNSGLMSEGNDSNGDYSLSEEEEAIIRSQKERFKGDPYSYFIYEIEQ